MIIPFIKHESNRKPQSTDFRDRTIGFRGALVASLIVLSVYPLAAQAAAGGTVPAKPSADKPVVSNPYADPEQFRAYLGSIKDVAGFQKVFIEWSGKTALRGPEWLNALQTGFSAYAGAFDSRTKTAAIRTLTGIGQGIKNASDNYLLINALRPFLYQLLAWPEAAELILKDARLSAWLANGGYALGKDQTAALAAILPKLMATPTFAGRSAIIDAVMAWPIQVDRGDRDAEALRKLLPLVLPTKTDFLSWLELAQGDRLMDWEYDGLTAKIQFAKPVLTEDEVATFLAHGLNLHPDLTRLTIDQSLLAWNTLNESYMKTALPALLAKSETSRRLRLLAALWYLAGNNNIITDKVLNVNPEISAETVATDPDDWTAFLGFYLLARGGFRFTDDQIKLYLDSKRPSLAAAALDWRFGADFPDDQQEPSPAEARPQLPESPFLTTVRAFLTTALKTPSPRLAIAALGTLYAINDTRFIDQLIVFGDSPWLLLRRWAANTIYRYGDSRVVALCLKRLIDTDTTIRQLAIKALGRLRDGRAVEPLGRILLDATEYSYLRELAAQALGEIGDSRSSQVFRTVLIDANSPVGARIAAAGFFASRKDKSAIDPLLAAIDRSATNRLTVECIQALGKIDDAAGKKRLAALAAVSLPVWKGRWFSEDAAARAAWACIDTADPALVAAMIALEVEGTTHLFPLFPTLYLYLQGPDQAAMAARIRDNWRSWIKPNDYQIYLYGVILPKFRDPFLYDLGRDFFSLADSPSRAWLASALSGLPSPDNFAIYRGLAEASSQALRDWMPSLSGSLVNWFLANKTVPDQAERVKTFATEIRTWAAAALSSPLSEQAKTDIRSLVSRMDSLKLP